MKINPIDHKKNLYRIDNIIPQVLLDSLAREPLQALPFSKMDWQEDIPRRRLEQMPGSILSKIHDHINEQKVFIGYSIGQSIKKIDTAFWLDQEGFTFSPHIDNPGVEKVMQIYLTNCPNAGTVFYDIDEKDVLTKNDQQCWHYEGPNPPIKIRKEFDFKINSGYLMINDKTQLHGVPFELTKDDVRLSVYCWIN